MTDDASGASALLRAALLAPGDATLAALAAAGPGAVGAFRDWLSRGLELDLPRGLGRDFADDVGVVSAFLADTFPDAYVAAFNSPRWRSTSWVLVALGRTGSPAVRPLLVEALHTDESEFIRLSAAIALRHLPGVDTVAALVRALDDPHPLVRYHAIHSLGAVGHEAVLARLRRLAAESADRAITDAAATAVRMLTQRLGRGDDG